MARRYRFPRAAVATPHYLATAAGARGARRRRQRDRCRPRREPRARRRRAVPLRLRRRRLRDRLGRRAARLPRLGSFARGSVDRPRARPARRDDAGLRPAHRHRARAVRGLVRPARALGHARARRARRRPRCGYARDGLRGHSRRARRCSPSRGYLPRLRRVAAGVRRARGRRRAPPARDGTDHRGARERRTRRVLPRPDRRRDRRRRPAAAAGSIEPVGPRGARRGVGRAAAGPYRDVEVAELPPPTQGVSVLEALRILDGFGTWRAVDAVTREHLLSRR